MKPAIVTFTGADDATSHAQMVALASDCPRVEFGILFSPRRAGTARYPSIEWINGLRRLGLRLSAHLCGLYSETLIDLGNLKLDLRGFQRVQINLNRKSAPPGRIRAWADKKKLHPILQCREGFPNDNRVAWIYNRRDREPVETWPSPPAGGAMVGFAGGLGLRHLPKLPAASPYWIDIKNGVRDEADRFSIGKCREVLNRLEL